jgi:hypothetical protein
VRIYRPTDSGATTAMRDGVVYRTEKRKGTKGGQIVRVTPKLESKKDRNREKRERRKLR